MQLVLLKPLCLLIFALMFAFFTSQVALVLSHQPQKLEPESVAFVSRLMYRSPDGSF